MCGVVAIAITIAAATSGNAAYQARRTQQRQQRFQEKQEAQRKANALAAMKNQIEAINQKQIAEGEAASLEIEANSREAQAAISQAQVTAGEVGAFGLNFEALIGEFSREQAEFQGAVERNLEIRGFFSALDRKNAILGKEARFINAELPTPPRPDYLGYGLQAIGNSFALYGAIQGSSNRARRAS